MSKSIKVIDLFAGPGGLGEGFSAYEAVDGSRFQVALSVEKEACAHSTLTLRAFFRQFGNDVPDEYYRFVRGDYGKKPEDHLYKKYPSEHKAALKEARCLALGKDNEEIYSSIRAALKGDPFVLIGGPPCQAYSIAGRSRNKGVKGYDAKKDTRNFLYLEYLNVIAKFQPDVFVMENVKGMLSAKIDGHRIFEDVIRDLGDPCALGEKPDKGRSRHRYKIVSLVKNFHDDSDSKLDPHDFVVKSENFGVPQNRHRVILLGLREDIAHKFSEEHVLTTFKRKTVVKGALSGLPALRSGLSKGGDDPAKWKKAVQSIKDQIAPALLKSAKPEHRAVGQHIYKILEQQLAAAESRGAMFGCTTGPIKTGNKRLNLWLSDKRLNGHIANNETRGHIVGDLHRYLFCSAWAAVAEKAGWEVVTPKSWDYPDVLIPSHANFKSGKFADRFRVQASEQPSTTVTSHISKDGNYYIHPDPAQCRSLTVREAARLQTFPDNYVFLGNRTQQYVQVGNAVPPFMAMQIAQKVCALIDSC